MKFIFHIGAGKTGSTSIQKALLHKKKSLQDAQMFYVGYLFEMLPSPRYIWQSPTGLPHANRLTVREFEDQVTDVLSDVVTYAKKNNIETIIWSNEILYRKGTSICKWCDWLSEKDIDVEIVAYARRHDKWSESAYKQFGLYGKTYRGPTKTFKQWIESSKVEFFAPLLPVLDNYGDKLKLRNLDAAKDAVSNFFELIKLPQQDNKKIIANQSISAEKLLIRAIFNGQYDFPVGGHVFNEFCKSPIPFNLSPQEVLNNLLPCTKDLAKVTQESQQDIESINHLLNKQGEPPLESGDIEAKKEVINNDKLLMGTLELVCIQAKKIAELENRLLALEKK